MRREAVAEGRTVDADPAGAWVKEWRLLIPPPGVWWRKSAFDLARPYAPRASGPGGGSPNR